MFELTPKTNGITREQVWKAWKQIKQGGRAVGVALVETNILECQQIAYEVIGRDKQVMKALTREDVAQLDRESVIGFMQKNESRLAGMTRRAFVVSDGAPAFAGVTGWLPKVES